jgi:hypothetical protein
VGFGRIIVARSEGDIIQFLFPEAPKVIKAWMEYNCYAKCPVKPVKEVSEINTYER